MTGAIEVDVQGADELAAKLQRLGKSAAADTAKIVNITAVELRGEIIKKIQRGPKTGATYRRGNIAHQASAPGQAPATDTGRLVGSIYFDRARGAFGGVAVVGSALAYASYLEYGTRDMRARPVWRKEAKKAQIKFIKRLEAYLRKATQ